MPKKDSLNLYFIALLPEEPIYSEIMRLKEECRDRFNTKAALRSPPHITLHMPFKWKEEKEEYLFKTLHSISHDHSGLSLQLDGFGAFEPRVIYVKVDHSEQLAELQQAVVKQAASDWHIYSMRNSRPFRPHLTIAFRDLKKPIFHEAWQEFSEKQYHAQMITHKLTLLKHNGKSWDKFQHFPLQ